MRSGDERRGDRGEKQRGEERQGEERGGEEKRTLPDNIMAVVISIPKGVLDCIGTSRAADFVRRTVEKGENRVEVGRDLVRDGKKRRSCKLLADLLIV